MCSRSPSSAFAPQDMFTADELSRRAGQMERATESKSRSIGGDGRFNIGVNAGNQWVPKSRPEELIGLEPGRMICFFENVANPLFTYPPFYFLPERLAQVDPQHLLAPNPYYKRRGAGPRQEAGRRGA
jgi:type IV secretory pathway TraG/TraD family ATPase VirD4